MPATTTNRILASIHFAHLIFLTMTLVHSWKASVVLAVRSVSATSRRGTTWRSLATTTTTLRMETRRKRKHVGLNVRGGAGDGIVDLSSPLLQGHRVSCFTTDANNNNNHNPSDEADAAPLPRLLGQFPVTGCAAIGWRPYMEDEALIQSDVVAVFDGHGGASVSRYVRQNLYGHLQAILPRVVAERQSAESSSNDDDTTSSLAAPTFGDYKTTLRRALEKINQEVLRILHWSYQGSTAVVCWLHEGVDHSSSRAENTENSPTATNEPVRTLVAANIGDSRVILSREGKAIALSRDHKPDDPIEMAYIESQGGKVTYPSGVPRVNGVMALSRAIGDRSETPCIRAEPDLILERLDWKDDFYVLSTDGLLDVFSSQEVVTYLKSLFDEGDLSDDARQEITKSLVLEALARGAEDNITVVVVWLR